MARAAMLTAVGVCGFLAAFDPPFSRGDEPIHPGQPATVWRTVTETRRVDRRVDGLNAVQWRARSIGNRRGWNSSLRRETEIAARLIQAREHLRRRWAPTAAYAISLASRVFGVSEAKMRAVAWCESTMHPWASNGRYRGLFQLGWSPFGFSPYDPVANALSTAQTVVRDGSWRQWACG